MLLKNILTTGSFNISAQIIVFIVEILIARILAPSDFGTFVFALVVVELLSIFSMKFYGLAFVQKKDTTDTDLSSIAIMAFSLSCLYAAASLLGIGYISQLWGGDDLVKSYTTLVWALPVITLEFVYRQALMKEKCFWHTGMAEIISVIIYAATVISLVNLGFGFYALLYAYVVRQSIKLIIILWSVKKHYVVLSGIKYESIKKLTRMSFAMTLQSLFIYSSSNTDKYFVDLSGGAQGVGLYTRALKLLQMPLNQIVMNVSSVLYVHFSHCQNDIQYLSDIFKKTTFILALIFIPATMLIIIFADIIINLIYGSQWLPMVPIFKVLAVGAVISSLSIIIGNLLKSQGIVYRETISNILALSTLILASYLLVDNYGMLGISIAFVLSKFIFLCSQLQIQKKITEIGFISYTRLYLYPVFVSLVIFKMYLLASVSISREILLIIFFMFYILAVSVSLFFEKRNSLSQYFM